MLNCAKAKINVNSLGKLICNIHLRFMFMFTFMIMITAGQAACRKFDKFV